ncbi:hypothetical protein ES703_24943 [subsurface metagenome]
MMVPTSEIISELLSLHPNIPNNMMPQYMWAIERMVKPGLVLDVGCDGSILDKYLERHGFEVLCADIDPKAAFYWNRKRRDPNKFFLIDCLSPLPSWHDKFDYITIICTLEHIETLEYIGVDFTSSSPSAPSGWRDCLHLDKDAVMVHALSHCLKPDGKMLITVNYGDGFDYEGRWKVRCYNENNISRITDPSNLSLNHWYTTNVEGFLPFFFAELVKHG